MTNPGVPPPERPAPDLKPKQLEVSGKSHEDLNRIKAILGRELGRSVTLKEVVEQLVRNWDNTAPWDDLPRIKQLMEHDTNRPLSDREVIERLIDHWENT